MPYINQHQREHLDPLIGALGDAIRDLERQGGNKNGCFNYVITSIIRRLYNEQYLGYQAINDAIGVLQCAMLEHYAQRARPYEDQKKETNGDV